MRGKKSHFDTLISYFLANIDWEEIEKLGMVETYFQAMEYYGRISGGLNAALKDTHYEILQLLNTSNRTFEELKDIFAMGGPAISRYLTPLAKCGYIGAFKEKNTTYYNITPLGKKIFYEEVNRLL